MGIRDLPLQIVDRFLDTPKNSGQHLNGGLGGVWQRRVYFGQLEQFVDAADSQPRVKPPSSRTPSRIFAKGRKQRFKLMGWMAPSRHLHAKMVSVESHHLNEAGAE
jgi:hypothetical protein